MPSQYIYIFLNLFLLPIPSFDSLYIFSYYTSYISSKIHTIFAHEVPRNWNWIKNNKKNEIKLKKRNAQKCEEEDNTQEKKKKKK